MKSSREAFDTPTSPPPTVVIDTSANVTSGNAPEGGGDPVAGDRRLRGLLDQVGDGVFMTDARGRILDVNPQGCEMLGYSRDELLTMEVRELSRDGPTTSARYDEEFKRVRPGQAVTIEDVCRRKDGSTFPVELRSRMLEGAEPLMVITLVRDVTERKRPAAVSVPSSRTGRMGAKFRERNPAAVVRAAREQGKRALARARSRASSGWVSLSSCW